LYAQHILEVIVFPTHPKPWERMYFNIRSY